MNSQFFEKIGVELPDGSPMVDATKLSKGQHYFVGPDKGVYIFKGNNRRERKISEIAFKRAGGKIS